VSDMNARAQEAAWLAQARLGMFKALATHRRRLQSEEPLSPDHTAALVELLTLLEEYVGQTWAPDMVTLTQMNSPR